MLAVFQSIGIANHLLQDKVQVVLVILTRDCAQSLKNGRFFFITDVARSQIKQQPLGVGP